MSPVHDYFCYECQATDECFVPLERLETEVVICTVCGREATRLMSGCGGDQSDYARVKCPTSGWYDESLNKTFYSMGEKKRYLKEKGLAEIPEGIHHVAREKRRQYFT